MRRLEPPLRTFAGTPSIAWMPDSRRVVMSIADTPDGSEQLWMVDTRSGARHALTSGTEARFGPTVAPAGNKLVFRESNGNYDLVSVDVATGGASTLLATDRNEAMPAWAANDNALAYVTNRNGPDEIWLRRSETPDRPIVSARDFPPGTTQWFMTPTLSPRGDRVIYTRVEPTGVARLWISSVAGGTPIRATRDEERDAEFSGAWAPDGSWLAYFGPRDGKFDLLKIKTSGEATPVLLKGGLDDVDVPNWSPTGEWICFGHSLISPDAKTERSLPQHGPAFYTFSKDGKLLYGLREDHDKQTLFSIDIASGAERVIGSGNSFAPNSYLSPSIHLSLSPDGTSFTYASGVIRSSLWLLEGFNPPDSLAARFGRRR